MDSIRVSEAPDSSSILDEATFNNTSVMLQYSNIDDYIASFPKDIQTILQTIRAIIQKASPKAEEVISYGMPAFKLNKVLVYFSGYKNHIGFYPTASGIKNFQEEISVYKNSKGAVQFPLDKPLPVKLITKIVKFRVAEDLANTKLKKK
jgi:uncharacterized protein YdhG (YjbR/CyaY superfamily)